MQDSSPFRNVLYTNSVPSDAECESIRTLLVGPRQEIAHLTDKIVATQAMLDDLMRKHAALNEFVTAHLALLSPIRRLPLDIMQEIFVACLPAAQNSMMAEADAPLLLCHVSRAWRKLALTTPRLWASLHICIPSDSRISLMNDAVTEWLEWRGPPPTPDIKTLINTLAGFSLRWEHMHFILPWYNNLDPLASLSPADVPILRTVTVRGFLRDDDPADSVADWNNLSFVGGPSVDSVCIAPGSNMLLIPLRWERLRRLSIRSVVPIFAGQALVVLKQCPLLETCSLVLRAAHISGHVPPPCRMEHLRHLYVQDHPSGAVDFFENLVAPNLTCLEYVASGDGGADFPFISMLSSSRSLERLNLLVSIVLTKTLLDTLSLVPTIRQLLLSQEPRSPADRWSNKPFGDRDPHFVSLLNSANAGGPLCPNLESIELWQFEAMSDQTLLDFIEERSRPALGCTTRLLSVRAIIPRERQADITPPLQPLIQDGLTLSLDYEPRPLVKTYHSPSTNLQLRDADWAPPSSRRLQAGNQPALVTLLVTPA
ncbi:hypothetical protein B0H11DRAFT_2267764 [Mycena galericulata]|nr:hypothetical protein B0H11DRAFT_2267764 [Mycena galericulata]